MADIDLFTYQHTRHRRSVPALQFDFMEKGTGNYWKIWAALDMIYLYRIGDELSSRSDELRIMDAELMVKRLECALLLAEVGMFQFTFAAAWKLTEVEVKDASTVTCRLKSAESKDGAVVIDWFNTFSQLNWLRRAAEDAHNALTLESEAVFFMYRGFEWLKRGMKVSWNDLGKEIDVPQVNINNLKRMANDWDTASRHAVESGRKVRFEDEVLPSWINGLLHGIVHARCKSDSAFAIAIEQQGDTWPI